ncbi:oxygen-independent coproporphyrinogen III oxidase [Halocynthiibacter sp.]|uniref:oxygen-independent coproporphyrinogen III oxidase n=1 Tax=Halocynthiibacter sp. TaxID=1979210 RepID=UPI003C44B194
MERISDLRRLGLFDARVPRYTSYPTAPVFSTDLGADFQAECLASLDPCEPVSVYVHVPFCERLCWFCACRTQGTQTMSPVAGYVKTLKAELEMIRARLPKGVKMGRLHWGGGTPTILLPEMIHDLAQAVKSVFPPADEFEFSVEIDPTLVDAAKIEALRLEGMNRASIGIQDFAEDVQEAIGRHQPWDVTKHCVDMLRAAGIHSLNADLVYGLPFQSEDHMRDTVAKVLALDPDRMALFGYAHVPHMAKRQKLIKEETLPGDLERYTLSQVAAEMFRNAGYQAIGIDHFAKADDELSLALQEGRLRRNFQGYTADHCDTLIGIGASSISSFKEGWLQNAPATGAWTGKVEAGVLTGSRGHRFQKDDLLRKAVIDGLMCNFELDLGLLGSQFEQASDLIDLHNMIASEFSPYVVQDGALLRITEEGRPLTRIIASRYDAYTRDAGTYSKAS